MCTLLYWRCFRLGVARLGLGATLGLGTTCSLLRRRRSLGLTSLFRLRWGLPIGDGGRCRAGEDILRGLHSSMMIIWSLFIVRNDCHERRCPRKAL